mmetsp:Transcript_16255/g.36705  ORF Transcript_16255/g.36705 Transcript_16255/m.36705 type:complete len:276 (+) Transcript_16255:474-1301(+)
MATDHGGALASKLRRGVEHPVAAEESLGLWLPRVPGQQALELLLAVLGAISLEASMNVDATPQQGMLLDVGPRAALQEVEVILRHSADQAIAVTSLSTVGSEGRSGAIAFLVVRARPATPLEVHIVCNIAGLLLQMPAPPAVALVTGDDTVVAVPRLAEGEIGISLGSRQQPQEAKQTELVIPEEENRASPFPGSGLLQRYEPPEQLPGIQATIAVVSEEDDLGQGQKLLAQSVLHRAPERLHLVHHAMEIPNDNDSVLRPYRGIQKAPGPTSIG